MLAEWMKFFSTLEAAKAFAAETGGTWHEFRHQYPKPYVEYYVTLGGTE